MCSLLSAGVRLRRQEPVRCLHREHRPRAGPLPHCKCCKGPSYLPPVFRCCNAVMCPLLCPSYCIGDGGALQQLCWCLRAANLLSCRALVCTSALPRPRRAYPPAMLPRLARLSLNSGPLLFLVCRAPPLTPTSGSWWVVVGEGGEAGGTGVGRPRCSTFCGAVGQVGRRRAQVIPMPPHPLFMPADCSLIPCLPNPTPTPPADGDLARRPDRLPVLVSLREDGVAEWG